MPGDIFLPKPEALDFATSKIAFQRYKSKDETSESSYFQYDCNNKFIKTVVTVKNQIIQWLGGRTISQSNLDNCLRHANMRMDRANANKKYIPTEELVELKKTCDEIKSYEKFGRYLENEKNSDVKSRLTSFSEKVDDRIRLNNVAKWFASMDIAHEDDLVTYENLASANKNMQEANSEKKKIPLEELVNLKITCNKIQDSKKFNNLNTHFINCKGFFKYNDARDVRSNLMSFSSMVDDRIRESIVTEINNKTSITSADIEKYLAAQDLINGNSLIINIQEEIDGKSTFTNADIEKYLTIQESINSVTSIKQQNFINFEQVIHNSPNISDALKARLIIHQAAYLTVDSLVTANINKKDAGADESANIGKNFYNNLPAEYKTESCSKFIIEYIFQLLDKPAGEAYDISKLLFLRQEDKENTMISCHFFCEWIESSTGNNRNYLIQNGLLAPAN